MTMTAAECRRYDRMVGPQEVGGRYYNGYWGEEYTVLAIEFRSPLWWITVANDEEAAQGREREHCTPWDPRRDKVVRQP